MTNSRASELLRKYQEGRCTPAEKELVERIYQEVVDGAQPDIPRDELLELKDNVWKRLEVGLLQVPEPTPVYRRMWIKWAAAAMVIGVAVTAFYLYNRKPLQTAAVAVTEIQDVAPGGNKAVLTLADGSLVNLSDANKGKLASAINITKTADGEVVYAADAADVHAYNTISTPKGGQFQVTLPDGTKVWLNAMSSLKFPVSFTTSSRMVELKGEAYFEVAQLEKPFIVSTEKQSVEVLGTHFNVNAYADEPEARTTLLTGKVRVRVPGSAKVLSPGQQVVNSTAGLRVQEADMDVVMAWKNGGLRFRDQDLSTVMREVERWYDVSVEFKNEKSVSKKKYSGYVSRASNLSALLRILALSNIETKLVRDDVTGATKLIIM